MECAGVIDAPSFRTTGIAHTQHISRSTLRNRSRHRVTQPTTSRRFIFEHARRLPTPDAHIYIHIHTEYPNVFRFYTIPQRSPTSKAALIHHPTLHPLPSPSRLPEQLHNPAVRGMRPYSGTISACVVWPISSMTPPYFCHIPTHRRAQQQQQRHHHHPPGRSMATRLATRRTG